MYKGSECHQGCGFWFFEATECLSGFGRSKSTTLMAFWPLIYDIGAILKKIHTPWWHQWTRAAPVLCKVCCTSPKRVSCGASRRNLEAALRGWLRFKVWWEWRWIDSISGWYLISLAFSKWPSTFFLLRQRRLWHEQGPATLPVEEAAPTGTGGLQWQWKLWWLFWRQWWWICCPPESREAESHFFEIPAPKATQTARCEEGCYSKEDSPTAPIRGSSFFPSIKEAQKTRDPSSPTGPSAKTTEDSRTQLISNSIPEVTWAVRSEQASNTVHSVHIVTNHCNNLVSFSKLSSFQRNLLVSFEKGEAVS